MPPWPLKEHYQRLLSKETGTIVKDPGGRLKIVALYPNTYAVGMANLGLGVLYRLINAEPGFLCERAFLPGRRAHALYQKTGAPLLSLESCRPAAEFDLVLASISFENDAPNLVRMLEHAGLGALAREREGPLVIAGGVVPMLNPEPLAEIMDGFLLGEAEVVLKPFLDCFPEAAGLPREEALLLLAREVPGFYAPRFYRPSYGPDGRLASFSPTKDVPQRIKAPKYSGDPGGLARSVVSAPGPQFGDMHLIEVGRGCGHGCRFCAAGHLLRPPRQGHARDFQREALAAAPQGGRVGLVSAAVTDLEGVDGLAEKVVAAGGCISVSSLRADRLTPELAGALAQSRRQSVALAPEAGSERLRRVINKRLGEEDLVRAVEMLITAGVPNLKFYFMLGLPGEEDQDLEQTIGLIKRLRQQVVSLSRSRGRLGLVTVSLNAFVPKPWTPFQWEAMAPEKILKARMKRLQKALAPLANLKVVTDVPKYAILQAALARGDRRLTRLLMALARDPAPQRAWKQTGLSLDFYALRRRERGELLPWDFVDHRISTAYLWAEAERARAAKESAPCDVAKCRRCGVCGDEDATPDASA